MFPVVHLLMNGSPYLNSIALPSRISYRMTMRIPVLVLLGLLMISSCDIFNKDEDPVAFIRVSDFTLTTNSASEGSATEDIGDVWLSIDGELLGAFEMPVDIPVLHEGPSRIRAFAGIKESGISTSRTRYPFYEIYDIELNLIDEQMVEIFPTTHYVEDALEFNDIEDFEIGINMKRSLTSDTTILREPIPGVFDPLYGGSAGFVYLAGDRNHFKVETDLDLNLALRPLVYLELDYRCDHPFVVGILRTEPIYAEVSLFGFNPVYDENGEPAWNKIYINLADGIDALQNAGDYDIFLESTITEGTEATFAFDNIKVIFPN